MQTTKAAEQPIQYFLMQWDGAYIFNGPKLIGQIWDELGGPFAGMELPARNSEKAKHLSPHEAIALLAEEMGTMAEYLSQTARAEAAMGYATSGGGRLEWSDVTGSVYFLARITDYAERLMVEMTRVGVLPG